MSDLFNGSANKERVSTIVYGGVNVPNMPQTIEQYLYRHPQKIYSPGLEDGKKPDAKFWEYWIGILGLEVFKPRSWPSTIKVPFTAPYVPKVFSLIIKLQNAIQPDVLELPLGEGETFPAYNPVYYVVQPDTKLIQQVIYRSLTYLDRFKIGEEELRETADAIQIRTVHSFLNTVRNNMYTSGTLTGQLHRLRDNMMVNQGIDGNFPAKSCLQALIDVGVVKKFKTEWPIEQMARIYEKYVPLNFVEDYHVDFGSWPGLFLPPSGFQGITTEDDPDTDITDIDLIDPANEKQLIWDALPPIGKYKMAGPPFPSAKKKGDAVLAALTLCDIFYSNVSSVIARNYVPNSNQVLPPGVSQSGRLKDKNITNAFKDLKDLCELFWWMGAGYLFPKAERYDMEEVLSGIKTRNIYAQSFVTYFFQSLIRKPAMANSANCLIDDRLQTMYGFSPFHGGMDTMINLFLREAPPDEPDLSDSELRRRNKAFIYADNLYVVMPSLDDPDDFDYWSEDLKKGESQHTVEDCMFNNYYHLTRSHVLSDSGKPAFNLTWAYIALKLLPNFQVDSVGILGNKQFKIPGLGSGSVSTYDLNNLKTCTFVECWYHEGCPRPDTEAWKELGRKTGVNFKTERYIHHLKATLEAAKAETTMEGFLQEFSVDDVSRVVVPAVNLDLLGWGASWSHHLKQWVPVLEEERLFLQVGLPKKYQIQKSGKKVSADSGPQEALVDETNSLEAQYYRMVRCMAAIFCGAWRIPPIYEALLTSVNDARKAILRLTETSALDKQMIAELLIKTEFNEYININDVWMPLSRNKVLNEHFTQLFLEKNSEAIELKTDLYYKWRDGMEYINQSADTGSASDKKIWRGKITSLTYKDIIGYFESKGWTNALDPQKDLTTTQWIDFEQTEIYKRAILEFNSINSFLYGEAARVTPRYENVEKYSYEMHDLNKFYKISSDRKFGTAARAVGTSEVGTDVLSQVLQIATTAPTTSDSIAPTLKVEKHKTIKIRSRSGATKDMTPIEIKKWLNDQGISKNDLDMLHRYYNVLTPKERDTMQLKWYNQDKHKFDLVKSMETTKFRELKDLLEINKYDIAAVPEYDSELSIIRKEIDTLIEAQRTIVTDQQAADMIKDSHRKKKSSRAAQPREVLEMPIFKMLWASSVDRGNSYLSYLSLFDTVPWVQRMRNSFADAVGADPQVYGAAEPINFKYDKKLNTFGVEA